jgi:hypothetical protein
MPSGALMRSAAAVARIELRNRHVKQAAVKDTFDAHCPE